MRTKKTGSTFPDAHYSSDVPDYLLHPKSAPKKIKSLDKQTLRALRSELDAALARVGTASGLSIKAGSCRFTADSATFKLEVTVLNADGSVPNPTAESFKLNATFFGLKPEDLGREFRSGPTRYKVEGAKPASRKYPIICKNLDTNKLFKLPAYTVVRGLYGEKAAAKLEPYAA